jgi:hypothetical protein
MDKLQIIFKQWMNFALRNRRIFNEIKEEEYNEMIFAETNMLDSLEWCKACKLGICERHFHLE